MMGEIWMKYMGGRGERMGDGREGGERGEGSRPLKV